ncbi:MAG: UxaA family hydrolase [Synergistetes bacterium]|nr:UxaA family hydrolase [Synergistota bacterium]
MKKALAISELDNVATALEDIEPGESVLVKMPEGEREIRVRARIPFGHKLSIKRVPKGGEVVKYGEVIGKATRDIEIGEWVHVHNVESLRGRGDLFRKEG